MASGGGLKYYFDADTSGFKKGVAEAETGLKRLHGVSDAAMGALKMGGLAAGAAFGTVLVAGIKTGVSEMMDAQKVSAQTAAVLKSTGGAAGVTKAQVEGLASSLQDLTGIQDDQIQSAENLLLTFTKIHKDTFPAATKAIADMSVAMHEDMSKAAVQVGKALNDPIKGITALQRVGVTFTQQQKDQIKAMVDSGHAADAQKLILRELNKEFGGSAEAYGKTLPGAIEKMKRHWEDFTQSAVEGAIRYWPMVQKVISQVVQWMDRNVVPRVREIVQQITGFWNEHRRDILRVMNAVTAIIKDNLKVITNVIAAFVAILTGHWGKAWQDIKNATSAQLDAIKQVLTKIVPVLLSAAENIGTGILHGIQKGLAKLAGIIRSAVINAVKSAASSIGDIGSYLGSKIVSGVTSIIPGHASGALIPGNPAAGDVVPAMLTPGEVVLNARQQNMLGRDRILQVLASTGATMGGSRFAQGGIAKAQAWMSAHYGDRYDQGRRLGPNSWDCSGAAGYIASMIPGYTGGVGNTTYGYWPMVKNKPAGRPGKDPVLWGFAHFGPGGPGHMFIDVGGKIFNAHGSSVHPNIDGNASAGAVWRVPPGLDRVMATSEGSPGNQGPRATSRGGTTRNATVSLSGGGSNANARRAGVAFWGATTPADGPGGDATTQDANAGGLTEDQAAALATVANFTGQALDFQNASAGMGIGSGGGGWDSVFGPSGPAVNVTIQALHPGDPSVLQSINNIVTRALGQTGGIPATLVPSGA